MLNLIADTCYSTTGCDCLSVLFLNILKVLFLLLPICDQNRITVAKLLIQIGITNSYHVVGTEGTVKSCKLAGNDNNVSSSDGIQRYYGIWRQPLSSTLRSTVSHPWLWLATHPCAIDKLHLYRICVYAWTLASIQLFFSISIFVTQPTLVHTCQERGTSSCSKN